MTVNCLSRQPPLELTLSEIFTKMYRKQRNWTCYPSTICRGIFITQNQGHYLYYITVRTGQVYPPSPQDCINEFIIQRLNPSVVVDLHSTYVMNSEFTPEVVMKFLPAQFSWIWCKCLQNDFIHSKIFQSDRIQRSYDEKFTAHHRSRNADLNLRLVAATTNGFIFQMINSLMQSREVRLPCLDCKT